MSWAEERRKKTEAIAGLCFAQYNASTKTQWAAMLDALDMACDMALEKAAQVAVSKCGHREPGQHCYVCKAAKSIRALMESP